MDEKLAAKLAAYWVPSVERCGLILPRNKIVEIKNSFPDPGEGFAMKYEDRKEYEDAMVATWHTHPKTSANLSSLDYRMFLSLPSQTHYIIAQGCIRSFVVRNSKVMNHETHRF